MPRRRQRTTNRVPQEERRLRVRGIRRGDPDAKRLSRAFIGLALARVEAEAQADETTKAPRSEPNDRAERSPKKDADADD